MNERPSKANSLKESIYSTRVDGVLVHTLRNGRRRLFVTGVVFVLAFLAVGFRIGHLTLAGPSRQGTIIATHKTSPMTSTSRANIFDRNGILLATNLPTRDLVADRNDLMDPTDVAARLATVLPDLDVENVERRLKQNPGSVRIYRNLTPRQHYEVNRLGLPGLRFEKAERRVYPHGELVAHLIGTTDPDGKGTSGVEYAFDADLRHRQEPLHLSLDLRVQSALRDGLISAVTEFRAIGAAGAVLDLRNNELIAMVSLPDFDPNRPAESDSNARFNRATKGVYEMGSIFKLFTAAAALDSGSARLTDSYDATKPLKVSRFTIRDFHPQNRWLSFPEVLVYSSNIGAARMAESFGTEVQKNYLDRFGLLERPQLELSETSRPLLPKPWRHISTLTISYGHGISVAPVHLAAAIGALINGGVRRPTTVLKHDGPPPAGERVISATTSKQIRRLMRMVVTDGTGRNAAVPGYRVGGKTGTANKAENKTYNKNSRLASFIGAFPMDRPRFVIVAMIDEPTGNESTQNYATGGWVAAPVVGRLVRQMAALYNIAPRGEDVAAYHLIKLNGGTGGVNHAIE